MLNFSHHEFYNSNVDLLPIFGGLQQVLQGFAGNQNRIRISVSMHPQLNFLFHFFFVILLQEVTDNQI